MPAEQPHEVREIKNACTITDKKDNQIFLLYEEIQSGALLSHI